MKPVKPREPVWRWNIFTFHSSHLRKCYLWAMPLLGGVSEGTQLEAHMGIIRDSQENLLSCLAYLPERLLIAHPTSGFAQSLCFYLPPHVVKRHYASKFMTEALCQSDNRKRKKKTTSLASFKDLVNYKLHSQVQEEESVCILYTR